MNARLCLVLSLLLALPLAAGGGWRAASPQSLLPPAPPPAPDQAQVAASLHTAPLMFIQNVGQFDPRARFQVHAGGGALWLADALWLTLLKPASPQPPAPRVGEGGESQLPAPSDGSGAGGEGVHLRLRFLGANPHPRLEPFRRLETHVSYFLGHDPTKWRADVPVWGGVRYVGLYPGVDLELSGEGGRWAWRLLAGAGADLSAVRLSVEGAERVAVEGDSLWLDTAIGPLALPPLLTGEGAVLPPTLANDSVTFTPQPSPLLPVSLDRLPGTPAGLRYSTFLGGSSEDRGYAIAVDASGAAYLTGETWSYNFPTTPGAFQTQQGLGFCNWPPVVCPDAFVTKLNPRGNGLVYATYLGGANRDYGYAIALDATGAAYITGHTYGDFPVTPGAFQTTFGGDRDAFVTKLNATGSALGYSTYLGGDWDDYGEGITVDATGSAYAVGFTRSPSFPTTAGAFQPTCGGGHLVPCEDAFVTKLNLMGSGLVYSTFLGGEDTEAAYGVAVDRDGEAYITGDTESMHFPTTPGAFQTNLAGRTDAFVTKLNASGTGLIYSTFLGGNNYDRGTGITVDASGAASITGNTQSLNFPVTPGAFQATCGGGGFGCYDVFITKVSPAGSTLIYSTFLGGSDYDESNRNGIAVIDEMIYVAGSTSSLNFPTTPGAFQTNYAGYGDAFVVKLDLVTGLLAYSTLLGGRYGDGASGVAVDTSGLAHITGSTWSDDFPITPGAFQTTPQGSVDSFVTKLEMTLTPRLYLPLILNGG